MFDWMSSLGPMLGNYGDGRALAIAPATTTPVPMYTGGYAVNMPQVVAHAPAVAAQRSSDMGLSDLLHSREQLAIALDMAGQAFDPKNRAAGAGTWLAQASLMNKASKAAQAQAGAGGGGASGGGGGTHVSVQPLGGNPDKQKLLNLLEQDHTPQGEGGLTTSSLKKTDKGYSLTLNSDDYASLINALGGNNQVHSHGGVGSPQWMAKNGYPVPNPETADWGAIKVNPTHRSTPPIGNNYNYGGANLNPW